MMGKRGAEKYYVVINLVLGLIVLAIVMYFLFHEYFTQEDINWETCRQSVLLRSTIPDYQSNLIKGLFTNKIEQFKSEFPLKCITEADEIKLSPPKIDWNSKNVYTITERRYSTEPKAILDQKIANGEEIEWQIEEVKSVNDKTKKVIRDYNDKLAKEISDRMLFCWTLFGSGKIEIFPKNLIDEKKSCVYCYRTSFSKEISEYFKELDAHIPDNQKLGLININMAGYISGHDYKGNVLINPYFPRDAGGNFDPSIQTPLQNIHLNPLLGWPPFLESKFIFYDDAYNNRDDPAKAYGMRQSFSPLDGSVLIGTYFYNNPEHWRWTVYKSKYPFYAQSGIDDLSSCDMETIPA